MRPDSIIWFERLSIGSLALGLVGAYLQWEELTAIGSVGFVLIILAFSMGLPLLLVLAVSRWRSKVAKWILVILTLLGYVMTAASFGGSGFGTWTPLDFLVAAVQLIALGLLFTPSAREWLAGKGANGDAGLQQTFE